FACDKTGAVTHMNAAGLRLLELLSAGAVSRTPMEAAGGGLAPVHPEGRPFSPAELPLLRALAGEVIVEEDGVLENPGSHRPVFLRSSAAPIRDATGAIAGAVAVARDGGWRGRLGAPPRGDPARGPRTADGPRRQRTYPAGSRQPPEQCAQVLARGRHDRSGPER